ncbi:MAG: putative 2OG-Fe(II) oxygenase [Gammaproteobacteria bacterium]
MTTHPLHQGQQLLAQGQFAQAETLFREFLTGGTQINEARYFLGIALHGLERWTEALAQLDQVDTQHALRTPATLAACNTLQALGRHDEVLQRLTPLQSTVPGDAATAAVLGTSHLMLGHNEQAIEQFEAARLADPNNVGVRQNLATAYRNVGRLDDAIASISQVIAQNDNNPQAHYMLGTFLLESEKPQHALGHAKHAYELNAFDRNALALYAIGLAECDYTDEALSLINYEALLRSDTRTAAPPTFDSMTEFHGALVEELRASDSLVHGSASRTTTGGWHSGNLLPDAGPAVAAFKTIIDERARDYFKQLPSNQQHPYFAWQPEAWQMSIWGVILESQGYQSPHMHPDGWLSGVYYVQVPAAVSGDSGAGCLEFGRGRTGWKTRSETLVRREVPAVGKLVLFPSYYYHRTIPFESSEERICFAFDVRPVVG